MNIPFVHQTLANGLDVIVHEDRDCPIVAVNVWYHVGSKNEQPGRTGFAHLFEHLMFEGSEHHDSGYFRPLQEVGGVLNGSTNADRTNYWEVVPSNAVELALWMESDRMGYLLPALTDAKFENQRNVVLNERRQNYENRPYGFAGMAIVAALYPPEHPYHWMTIGAAEDLKAARLDDVRAFFQTYYRPRNASLALAGDIDAARAIALANDYFGGLEAGPEPPPVNVSYPSLSAETRLVLEDRIELPRLYLAWHSPALFAEDDAELDLVSEVLAGGKTSRLYRSLVYEQRIATEVAVSQGSRELGSFFQIVATAAPGRTLAEVEEAIARELARFHDAGPSAGELERCLAQAEAHFLHRLQTVGGFGGKSDQLNAYNVYLGAPGYFDEDLARYRQGGRCGPAPGGSAMARSWARGVERRSARSHRARARRLAIGVGILMAVDRSRLPLAGPEPAFAFPEIRRRHLSNGLDAWTAVHAEVPLLSVLVMIRAGAAFDPADRPGLAAISGDLLDEGCGDLDALALHESLGRLGAQLDTEVGSDATLIGLTTLERSAPAALALLADMIARPRLETADFERVRDLRLNRLLQMRDMPPAVAERIFTRRLYGAHPYGHLPIGTDASLRAMDPGEPRAFHEQMYEPSRATVIAVGNGSHESLGDAIERAFGRLARQLRREPPGRSDDVADSAWINGAVNRAESRCSTVGAAHRPCSGRQEFDGLPRARRAESRARRPVRQPHQHESAGTQGLHLQRANQLRVQTRARSVCAVRKCPVRRHGRRRA